MPPTDLGENATERGKDVWYPSHGRRDGMKDLCIFNIVFFDGERLITPYVALGRKY